MYIMIPDTAARMSGNTGPPAESSTPNIAVTAMQIRAPISSLNPDRVAYSRALPLLLVA